MTTNYKNLPTRSADPLDIEMGEYDLEYGFSLNYVQTSYCSSQVISTISLFYDNIHWMDKDRKFLNDLANKMEFLSMRTQSDMDAVCDIDGSIEIKPIIQDDRPKIRCTIRYQIEGEEEVFTKEIFLELVEAFCLAKNVRTFLLENKIVSFQQL